MSRVRHMSDSIISIIIGKDGELRHPGGDVRLQAEDEVVAITTHEGKEDLYQALTKMSEE